MNEQLQKLIKESVLRYVYKKLINCENPSYFDSNSCRIYFTDGVEFSLNSPDILKAAGLVKEEWVSLDDRLPEEFKFGGYLVLFEDNQGVKRQCVASFENIPQHNFDNPPMHKTWFVYPSSGHRIYPTHWKPLPLPPKTNNQ